MNLSKHATSLMALLVACLALFSYILLPAMPALGRKLGFAPYLPWHENPAWERLLQAIDKLNDAYYFPGCSSTIVETSFGKTQTYACGQKDHSPILLFHSAQGASTMWGDWMTPALVNQGLYVIMIDFVRDNGRSIPKDGDPLNCPSSEQEIAKWVEETVTGLQLRTPVSMLGSSYGALIAFISALYNPSLVDKLVLLAPIGVVSEVNPGWVIKWLISRAFPSNATQNWFYSTMTANSSWFELLKDSPLKFEQELAMRDVSIPAFAVQARSFPDDKLRETFNKHAVFLGMGELDYLVPDPFEATKRAKDSGASQVLLYPKAGHFLFESPTKEFVVDDVVRFLQVQAQSKSGTLMEEVITNTLVE